MKTPSFSHWAGDSLQSSMLIAVALAFLIPGAGLYLAKEGASVERARTSLESDPGRNARVLSAALRKPLWELGYDNTKTIIGAIASDDRFASITVIEETNGKVFAEVSGPAARDAGAAIFAREEPIEHEGTRVGRVVVRMSLAPYIEAERRGLWENLLQLAIVLAISLSVIVYTLRRRVSRPLGQLTESTRRIANEDL